MNVYITAAILIKKTKLEILSEKKNKETLF